MVIERKIFLELCQKVSVIPEIHNIRKNIPDELLVKYDNIKYYPVSYILSFDKGKPVHTAVLHDTNTNSIIQVDLGKVRQNE